ncbi:hypothetical protein GCM10010331_77790 [Streptomyces xanthochromogenes]|nr:hypothetical protein GCM10010331_77790 [Streptomyces xanthochromogenes]
MGRVLDDGQGRVGERGVHRLRVGDGRVDVVPVDDHRRGNIDRGQQGTIVRPLGPSAQGGRRARGDRGVLPYAPGDRPRPARLRQRTARPAHRERNPAAAGRVRPGPDYCWWKLPAPWRAETFAAAAAGRLGIAVTPGTAFAVGAAVPDAVRIGLATPPVPVLDGALRRLAALAATAGP